MNTVKVENCNTLFIGRRGENEVTEVVFDFTEWQEQFGAGVIDLYVKRSVDFDAYPVVLSVDGTVATWLVTDADTAVVGSGKIEFVYTVNEKVAKSAVFPFYVGEDIGQASSEPPDPYESWIETLTELGTETQANAQAAAQSASDAADSAASASESAGQAEDSAEDAEAWAVGERNGEPVAESDPTYNNNSKYWAENARSNAPVQSVNGKDGNVELTLDDIPNGETYARATPAQLAQIGTNAEDIADIDAMIPNTTSESNHLVNVSFLTNRLTSYRTSAAQDAIDSGKQDKITAYGILKRDRSGNITAAVAGADYVTADALNSYREATAQDAIDNAQSADIAAINDKIPSTASKNNKLVAWSTFNGQLGTKQAKITANGILKGDGAGGVSAAVPGTDYLAPSALDPYRTAADQDEIDNAQDERLDAVEQTTTATTIGPVALATFDASAADMPLKGLTVDIEPIQSGTGDPSPDNVRPISGRTSATIYHSGADTSDPITYTIQLGDTVYGGTLDVTGGKMTVDRRYIVADGVNIKVNGGYGANGPNWLPCIVLNNNTKAVNISDESTIRSSYLKPGNVQNDQNSLGVGNGGLAIVLHIGTMQGTDGTHGYNSAAEVYAAVNAYLQENPLQICYKIATPIEITLSPTQIETLLGTNNIWSDAGDVTVIYGAYLEALKAYVDQNQDKTIIITGTTPTISAKADYRYICGEVSTLDITLPTSGIVDIVFTSGSTPTVLTITPPTGVTLKWANGFDPTALEANTTYEINIMDGLGVAASWT